MGSFLQSEAWAKVEEARGHQVVQIFDDAPVFGFVYTLPVVGKYLYMPRWPENGLSNMEERLAALIEKARVMGVRWVRIEPETEEIQKAVFQQGARKGIAIVRAPHDMQPRENLIIDITHSEEELLASMKSKVRYNVRLAEKKTVRVFMTRTKKYQDIFCNLIEATAKRQNIVPHPLVHYMQICTLLPESMCQLMVAEYEGEVLAANLLIFFGNTATYLHGGTSDSHREVMAPILLQWECIREAKRRGCSRYDFGGVNTQKGASNQHLKTNSWAGITRFKTGFSPATEPTRTPGCYDIIVDARYYRVYDRLRLLQRGFSILKKFLRK